MICLALADRRRFDADVLPDVLATHPIAALAGRKRVEEAPGESEQRRIVQDLHDGLGQQLTWIALPGKVFVCEFPNRRKWS